MSFATRKARSCFALLVGALWFLPAACAIAQDSKTVLVLYGNTAELPWIKIFDASLRTAVTGATSHRVEFYTEYFDVARFPAERHQEAFINYLRERYSGRKIDVLVSGGTTAFDFLLSRKERVFPEPPLVYSLLPPNRTASTPLPAGVLGVPADLGHMPTIDLALRLHPAAKRLVLVTGAGPWDRDWEKRLREDTAGLRGRLELEFLAGLPTVRLLERLSALPKDAVVFTPGYFHDGAGEVFAPSDAVQAMAARSAAPVYVAYETHVGTGAVGGVITTFDAVGRQTGAIVASLLDGKPAAALALPRFLPGEPIIDWRQARRWGINERALPAGTVVRYREPGPWDRYWREISIGIVVVLLQLALIVALLVERRGRRRTVAALDASEQRMDLAARAAKLTTWVWDVARDRFWLSPRSRGRVSFSDDEPLTLEHALREMHPADRDRVERAARQALAANEDMDIEYRVVRPDGEVRWIAVRGRAEPGGGPRLLGVALDVTGRKAAELEAERVRTSLRHMTRVSALGQLSAAIAHELNQPLAAILNNAEAARKMLGREQVDFAELREICDDIVTEDNRAAEVIRRLRTLFQRGELQLQPLDVNELIRDTLDLLHNELLTRHVTAVTDLAPSLPTVEGGRVQLQQVLLNLIVNAADAMEKNAEEERKLVIRTDLEGTQVRICVADRGPGIAAADLENIFEPFWSSKPGGMGMGLAICRSIVSAHHGTLTATNANDRGATFCITLPMRHDA